MKWLTAGLLAALVVALGFAWSDVPDRVHYCQSGYGVAATSGEDAARVWVDTVIDGDSAALECFGKASSESARRVQTLFREAETTHVRLVDRGGASHTIVVEQGDGKRLVELAVTSTTYRPWWSPRVRTFYTVWVPSAFGGSAS